MTVNAKDIITVTSGGNVASGTVVFNDKSWIYDKVNPIVNENHYTQKELDEAAEEAYKQGYEEGYEDALSMKHNI